MPLPLLSLQDFKPESLALEVRYDPSYLHWDRSGEIWMEALARWPELKNLKGEPATTQFTLRKRYHLTASIDRASVADYRPQHIPQDLLEIADPFFEFVSRHMHITDYARIGLRPVFVKQFDTSQEASIALLSMHVLSVPGGPHFGIETTPAMLEYAIRWEGSSHGVRILVKAEKREYELDPPLNTPFEHQTLTQHLLVLDFDYFTIGRVSLSQLRLEDWIKQALHVFRRDVQEFLGGLK